MTTYAFPDVTPNNVFVEFESNAEIFQSPQTGAIQTDDRGGERLVVRLVFRNLKTATRALLIAWLAKMNGQQHRVNLPFHALDQQGLFGGTPIVNGAAQTGNYLLVGGASNNITGWMIAGDVFSFNGEMKICTADAHSNGAGAVGLYFSPRIRNAPPNSDPIETTDPTGVFMLLDPKQSWSYRPGKVSDINIALMEDIAA